jgi:hypothetical protein
MSNIIFHFNKGSIKDKSIPPWIVKYRGETFYVHHLISDVGFKTRETPDHPSTKGSIVFKGDLEIKKEGDLNVAHIKNKK